MLPQRLSGGLLWQHGAHAPTLQALQQHPASQAVCFQRHLQAWRTRLRRVSIVFQALLSCCRLTRVCSAFSDGGGGAERLPSVPGLPDTGSQQTRRRYISDSTFNQVKSILIRSSDVCLDLFLQLCFGLWESSSTLMRACSQLCTVTTWRCVCVCVNCHIMSLIVPLALCCSVTACVMKPVSTCAVFRTSSTAAGVHIMVLNDGVRLHLCGCRTRPLLRRQELRGRKSS